MLWVFFKFHLLFNKKIIKVLDYSQCFQNCFRSTVESFEFVRTICSEFSILRNFVTICMSIHGFSVKKKCSWLILWMRGTHKLCKNWVGHQNCNDFTLSLFGFINQCFHLLQLFKLIWEKYLKTNCQSWMFHQSVLISFDKASHVSIHKRGII